MYKHSKLEKAIKTICEETAPHSDFTVRIEKKGFLGWVSIKRSNHIIVLLLGNSLEVVED